MKRIIQAVLFISLMLVTSSAFSQKIKEILIPGIQGVGQFANDPAPVGSEYLSTRTAGFYVSEYGARYYCGWDIVKVRSKPIYVRIELSNPADVKNPIIQEGEIQPDGRTLNIAFGPLKNLKMKNIYSAKVTLYEDETKTVEIDHLVQNIKAYVDTRKTRVIVDKSQLTSKGERVSKAMKKINLEMKTAQKVKDKKL